MGMKEEVIRVINEKFVEMEKSLKLYMEMESKNGLLDQSLTSSGVINIMGRLIRIEANLFHFGMFERFVDGVYWDK